jgi:hypothetical protein
MGAAVVIIILLMCCCLSFLSSSVAALVVQQQQSSSDDGGDDEKVKPLPDWMRKLVDPNNTTCQELTNKYGIYPGYAQQYISSGQDKTKYALNECASQNLWPVSNLPVSNLYSAYGRNSKNGLPYVGVESSMSEIANTDGRMFANVQPGPQLCIYKNGVKTECISGTPMQGSFAMGFDKYANFCMIDSSNSNNIAWCALPRFLDSSVPTTSYAASAAFVHSKKQLFNGGTFTEVDTSNRTAILQPDGRICIYEGTTGSPVWCNKNV